MKARKWTDEMLLQAVRDSRSVRQVMQKLGLVPAGGNYVQVRERIKTNQLDTSHFLGQGWSRGLPNTRMPVRPLDEVMRIDSNYQSFKLKKRLFGTGLKKVECEECGWKKVSEDGRIPLELDHINGVRTDNRIENLRILCPNCHSLKPTHRGKNKKKG